MFCELCNKLSNLLCQNAGKLRVSILPQDMMRRALDISCAQLQSPPPSPQQNTLLQKFAALAFNLTKLTFISCMKGLFSWNYFICMLHIYDTLIGFFTLSRLGFFCLVGSDRGQYFQNYYMYANEIITGWSYCKTEYTLYFCC